MDCNGCVQRIKKAISSIEGVHNVYVDRPQQKLTVVGQAAPETLVQAIKKTRKIATISSHTEPSASDPPPSTEPEAKQDNNPQSSTDAPPVEPTTDPPKEPPPQENSAPDQSSKPSQEDQEASKSEAKDVEQVHMMHHYPHGRVIREHWNDYPPMGHQIGHEAPYYVTHSYNNYRPSPHVTEYGYLRAPAEDVRYRSVEPNGGGYYQNPVDDGYYQNRLDEGYYHNRGGDEYYQNRGGDGYYQNQGSDGNQVSSMFSDENPNACRIA
ncbi:uncharacterized protein LOC109849511 isoform X2 [Asparagus officinalis]|nr:uncharacterized protein LOC109849511 isoform X2 [Asparagus officinalis]